MVSRFLLSHLETGTQGSSAGGPCQVSPRLLRPRCSDAGVRLPSSGCLCLNFFRRVMGGSKVLSESAFLNNRLKIRLKISTPEGMFGGGRFLSAVTLGFLLNHSSLCLRLRVASPLCVRIPLCRTTSCVPPVPACVLISVPSAETPLPSTVTSLASGWA